MKPLETIAANLRKTILVAFAIVLTMQSNDIVKALEDLPHEILAHKIFQRCITNAAEEGKIPRLKKTSLFRTSLAYFLLVPDARDRFLKELQTAT